MQNKNYVIRSVGMSRIPYEGKYILYSHHLEHYRYLDNNYLSTSALY
jgi:hypothetical protein